MEKEDEQGEESRICYARAYRVFNADQIEGLPAAFYGKLAEAPRDLGTTADLELDAFFAATGADIRQNGYDPRAYYAPATDHINMPLVATFESASRFYGVLAHEVTHYAVSWIMPHGRVRRLLRLLSAMRQFGIIRAL